MPRGSLIQRSPTAAARYRALADDTRMRILIRLAGREVCVCDLVDELGVAQPLLSFHLRVLRQAGLVRAERRGRWSFYRLDAGGLEAAGDFLSDLVAEHAAAAPVGATCC
jgi:ArsR family transcriptional regulator